LDDFSTFRTFKQAEELALRQKGRARRPALETLDTPET